MVVSVVARLPAHLAIVFVSIAGVLKSARWERASRRRVEHPAGIYLCRTPGPGVGPGSAAATTLASPVPRLA